MDSKKLYQRNYYIQKRNYIRNLSYKDSIELTEHEQIDLDKYIFKFRPRSTRYIGKERGYNKGELVEFKQDFKTVIIDFK